MAGVGQETASSALPEYNNSHQLFPLPTFVSVTTYYYIHMCMAIATEDDHCMVAETFGTKIHTYI